MQHIPGELVKVWKQRDLDPKKLIPALVTQTQNNDQESIKYAVDYLEHCVYKLKNEEQAIHDYLVSLYCKMDDETPLLRYVNGQGEVCDLFSILCLFNSSFIFPNSFSLDILH